MTHSFVFLAAHLPSFSANALGKCVAVAHRCCLVFQQLSAVNALVPPFILSLCVIAALHL